MLEGISDAHAHARNALERMINERSEVLSKCTLRKT